MKNRAYLWAAAVVLVVVLSRLPYLSLGYGTDADGCRVARSAQVLHDKGEYQVSRFPGYPVQEVLSSLLIPGGPIALNSATLFFSILALVMVMLIAGKPRQPDWVAGLAFAFTPIIYINSMNSMDYLWALGFLLTAFWFSERGKLVMAGIFLGLATGCRITSAQFGLPLVLLAMPSLDLKSFFKTWPLWVAGAAAGLVSFLPIFLTYGLDFMKFVDGGTDWFWVTYFSTLGVWGLLGLAGVGSGLVFAIFSLKEQGWLSSLDWEQYKLAWVSLLVILQTLVVFIRLPAESGYLIPIVPFVIFGFGQVLSKQRFVLVCGLLALSSFTAHVNRKGIQWYGPVHGHYGWRMEQIHFVQDIFQALEASGEHRILLISGAFEPRLEVSAHARGVYERYDSLVFIQSINTHQAESFKSRGFSLFLLPRERQTNMLDSGIDPLQFGARVLELPVAN